jgi:hypothetical protein
MSIIIQIPSIKTDFISRHDTCIIMYNMSIYLQDTDATVSIFLW